MRNVSVLLIFFVSGFLLAIYLLNQDQNTATYHINTKSKTKSFTNFNADKLTINKTKDGLEQFIFEKLNYSNKTENETTQAADIIKENKNLNNLLGINNQKELYYFRKINIFNLDTPLFLGANYNYNKNEYKIGLLFIY